MFAIIIENSKEVTLSSHVAVFRVKSPVLEILQRLSIVGFIINNASLLLLCLFLQCSVGVFVLLEGMHALVPAPDRYPDIYARLVSAVACIHLCLAYLYGVYLQLSSK